MWKLDYPHPPETGYWGLGTATIDWCEENYVVTPYIAECMNTFTNLGFIILALFTIQNAIAQGFGKKFVFTAIGFAVVGIGSWLFHMTLWYEYQLLDELPMIYATCVPTWLIFSFHKSQKFSIIFGTCITIGAGLLTVVYLYFKDPTIHQVFYAALNIVDILWSLRLISTEVDDPFMKKRLYQLSAAGVGTFLFGYALWQADVHLCNFFIRARRSIGMPLGFLLEGHAWWHLFTGQGVYFYIVVLEYLTIYIQGQKNQYELVWNYLLFPYVKRIRISSSDKTK